MAHPLWPSGVSEHRGALKFWGVPRIRIESILGGGGGGTRVTPYVGKCPILRLMAVELQALFAELWCAIAVP